MDKKKKYIIVGVGILLVSIGIGIVIKRLLNKAPDDTLPIKKNVESTQEETNNEDGTTTQEPKIPKSVDTKIGTRLRTRPNTNGNGFIRKTYQKIVNLPILKSIKKDDGVWYFVEDIKDLPKCTAYDSEGEIISINSITGQVTTLWGYDNRSELNVDDKDFFDSHFNNPDYILFKDPTRTFPVQEGDVLYWLWADECAYRGWVREDVVTPKY